MPALDDGHLAPRATRLVPIADALHADDTPDIPDDADDSLLPTTPLSSPTPSIITPATVPPPSSPLVIAPVQGVARPIGTFESYKLAFVRF